MCLSSFLCGCGVAHCKLPTSQCEFYQCLSEVLDLHCLVARKAPFRQSLPIPWLD